MIWIVNYVICLLYISYKKNIKISYTYFQINLKLYWIYSQLEK